MNKVKRIQTRIFKLSGVWQLGFPGLNKVDIERLRSLHAFRYNSTLKMWHMAHHVNSIVFLNNKYDGFYSFIADPTPRDKAPVIEASKQDILVKMIYSKESDQIKLTHGYHKAFFTVLKGLNGAVFDRENRQWLLSYSRHYKTLKSILDRMHCQVEEVEEKQISAQTSGHDIENDVEIRAIMEQFRKEMFLRNNSKRTMESYLYAIKCFLKKFYGRDHQEISHQELQDYMIELGERQQYAYSTLNIHISAIKLFYKYIYGIVLRQVDIPRPRDSKRLPKHLEINEVKLMIERTHLLKHKTILVILYSTGIRREELINLKLEQIDLEKQVMRIIGKGDKERLIIISESLRQHLEDYLKAYTPKEYLFEGPRGAYSPTSVANVVKKAAQRAGIKRNVSPHMLRHSFATHMISKGVGFPFIQQILGHSNIKTTLIYTHLSKNDFRSLPNPLDDLDI